MIILLIIIILFKIRSFNNRDNSTLTNSNQNFIVSFSPYIEYFNKYKKLFSLFLSLYIFLMNREVLYKLVTIKINQQSFSKTWLYFYVFAKNISYSLCLLFKQALNIEKEKENKKYIKIFICCLMYIREIEK